MITFAPILNAKVMPPQVRNTIRAVAVPLGLWSRWERGRATDTQRRRLLKELVGAAVGVAHKLAEAFVAGLIDLATWAGRMMALMESRYDAAPWIMLWGGSNPQIEPVIPTATQERKRHHYLLFWAFWTGLAGGSVALDRRVVTRSGMYLRAAWSIGANAVRDQVAERQKITLERRILGEPKTHHCGDCPGLAAMGWQPFGSLPSIGDTTCMVYCYCHFEFK